MIIAAIILAQAMGGTEPEGVNAMATRACARKVAQLAASHGTVGVSTRVAGDTQELADGRYLLQLDITIRYRRRTGDETRRARIGCVVNKRGHVDALGEPIE